MILMLGPVAVLKACRAGHVGAHRMPAEMTSAGALPVNHIKGASVLLLSMQKHVILV